MTAEQITINGREHTRLVADEGKTFVRKHDSLEMGDEIILGVDHSLGEAREDKAEYYEEVEKIVAVEE